ncbi:MAG: hypothetical protein NXI30_05920 [bacterium]|nr:hypothetical protein [bacterium]
MTIIFSMRKLERAPTALLLETLARLTPSTLPVRELERQLRVMGGLESGPTDGLVDPFGVDLSLDVVETDALRATLEVLQLARQEIRGRYGTAQFALLFVHLLEIHTHWAIFEHVERGELGYAN